MVRKITIDRIPPEENFISSHVIYKVKINDSKQLYLKERITPHGNEYSSWKDLQSYWTVWSPVGMRILLSIVSSFEFRLSKLDVKTSFIQTGHAKRDVFFIPPRESNDRCIYLYGLINAN